MRPRMRTPVKLAAMLVCLAMAASAYYPFVHYQNRVGPFVPIPEKFDLASLSNKTVHVHVTDVGPARLAPGDSFTSVVSQIRMAAKAWNDVETADLRVAFGGLFTPGTPQNAPRIEVMFDDVPGVLARCAPVSRLDVVSGPAGPFVPIVASTCIFNRDISQRPSFGEAFFLTAVHELGHALGLQHTLASSAMSTEITRATTRATPLAADDIAGLSALYPTPRFLASTGSISGQVSMAGLGVHMASVVALAPERAAVSALTNPDGTFRIDGLAPGQYYVYVHPLPPSQSPDLGPAEIVLPLDADHRPIPIPAGDSFDTQFYPGARDPQQATMVPVTAGAVTGGILFSVQRRGAPQLYAVTTYSYPGQVAVKPAHLSPAGAQMLLAVASSPMRLTVNGAPTPGMSISVLGGGAAIQQIRSYAPAPQWLQIDFALGQANPGPRHLVFSIANELYVQPSAFHVTAAAPPQIQAVLPGLDSRGNRWVAVTGNNLTPDTRVVFDGMPSHRVEYLPGVIVVTPPPGAPNYQATVTALNSDGQSSLFLQTPPTYAYDPGEAPSISIAPGALPAGVEAMVEITGISTSFTEGQTVVGFGTSDVAVRRVWVLSPTRLRAQVAVSPSAANVASLVSVVSGFQIVSVPHGFQVAAANPRLPVVNPQLLNPTTGQPGVYAGSPALAQVANLSPMGAVAPVLLLNEQPVPVTSLAPGQIGFTVPAGVPSGPAVLRLLYGPEQIYPVIVNIDPPPPSIVMITTGALLVDALRPARPGEPLIVMVTGLAEAGTTIAPSRIRITVGGVEHTAMAVAAGTLGPSSYQILFMLSANVPAGPHPITVSLDGRASLPGVLYVRTP